MSKAVCILIYQLSLLLGERGGGPPYFDVLLVAGISSRNCLHGNIRVYKVPSACAVWRRCVFYVSGLLREGQRGRQEYRGREREHPLVAIEGMAFCGIRRLCHWRHRPRN